MDIVQQAEEVRAMLIEDFPEYAEALRRPVVCVNRRLRRTIGRVWTLMGPRDEHGHRHIREQRVEFNPTAIELNPHIALNTYLHEWAHVAAGAGSGHSWEWRQVCHKFGCRAERFTKLQNPIPRRRAISEWNSQSY